MVTEKTGNKFLDDFSLDDGEENFFNIKDEEDEVNIKKEIKKDELDEEEEEDRDAEPINVKDKKTKKEAKKKDEEEDDDDDFEFGKTEDTKVKDKEDKDTKVKEDKTPTKEAKGDKDTKGNKEDKEDEEGEDEDDFFTSLAVDLKEKGILSNVEIPDDKKLTEDEFFKLQDDEIENRVAETFEALFEEIGEEGSNFLKYIKDGGNPRTFLGQISKRFSLDELDVENDNQVNKTLTHYLSVFEKADEEEIADKLKWLEDSGKKKAYATKYFKTIKETEKQEEADLLKEQQEAVKARQLEVKEFNDSLKEVLSKTEAVGSIVINKKEYKEITDYILKPTVKKSKNNYVPEFYDKLNKTLRGKTDEDKRGLIAIAKVLKENFKLTGLEATTETKVVSRAKSRISDKRNSVRNISSGSTLKSLADLMT